MKLWKKILLALLAVALLAQIPFIYRRYKIGQLADRINSLARQRIELVNPNFNEYKGIIHAHTSLGGHSTGTFTELINAAQTNRLDFVVMTEHTIGLYDTSALTLHGFYNNVLFVNGQEVPTATDRFLQLPGDAESNRADKLATPDYLQKVRANNELAIVAYPEKSKTFEADFDGIEIFNLYTNAQKINPFLAFFDMLWSYHG